MATEKSNKVWVKLNDTGSIFSDSGHGIVITGKRAIQVEKSIKRVAVAIRNNVLKEVSEEEAEKLNAQFAEDNIVAPNKRAEEAEKLKKTAEALAKAEKASKADKAEIAALQAKLAAATEKAKDPK